MPCEDYIIYEMIASGFDSPSVSKEMGLEAGENVFTTFVDAIGRDSRTGVPFIRATARFRVPLRPLKVIDLQCEIP